MATVATLGALAAYRGALADDDASGATRLLDEGQILELDKRQRYLDDMALAEVYRMRTEALREQAHRRTAAPLDQLQAQEDLAAARIAARYWDYYDWNLEKYSLEGELERWTANDLGELGFNVSWEPSYDRAKVTPDIWVEQRSEIDKLGTQLTSLTGAVVFFVLSLLCLTLADLAAPHRRKLWVVIGVLSSVVAGFFILLRTHDAATIAVTALGLIAGGALAVKLLTMTPENPPPDRRASDDDEHEQPAAELDPVGYIGSRVHVRPTHGAFSRVIVVAIGVTAVLSAICGYLYSRSAGHMNAASSAAVADQATEFRENTRSRAEASAIVGAIARVQEDQARRDATVEADQLVNEGLLDLPQAVVTHEEELQRAIYQDDLDRLPAETGYAKELLLGTDDPSAVRVDPRFPSRLIEDRASLSSDRAFAMWDADNQRSLAFQSKMSLYLFGLTMFAIALYLFGQSMGIGGVLAARILAGAAAAFALVGAGVMFWSAWSPVVPAHGRLPTTAAIPDECNDVFTSYEAFSKDEGYQAAAHYACGRHLARIARTADQYRNAAAQFALATAYRPTFALAHFAHAANLAEAGSPQRNASYSTLPTSNLDDLRSAVTEERTAVHLLHEQGFDNPNMLENLGYDEYVRGLLTSNRSDVEDGAAAVDEGVNQYTRFAHAQGWVVMDQALLLAARGRFDEAEARYVQLAKTRPNDTSQSMALGGMTDLEFLSAECSKLLDTAQCAALGARLPQLKSEVAGTVWTWKPPASSQADPTVVADRVTVTPGGAFWSAHVTASGNDSVAGKELLAVWYQLDPTWRVWVALPQLQGDPQKLDASGRASQFSAVLPANDYQSCLDGGSYRVEFYLQGQPAGQALTTNSLYGYTPNFDPRLNLAICSPPPWKRDDVNSQDGVVTMMYPPTHYNALMLVRRDDPQHVSTAVADQTAARELGSVLNAPVLQGPSGDTACAAPDGWHRRWYETRRRSVLVETHVDKDGELYEGFFVARGTEPDAEQCAIADSLVELP